jgi:hypothetical protein
MCLDKASLMARAPSPRPSRTGEGGGESLAALGRIWQRYGLDRPANHQELPVEAASPGGEGRVEGEPCPKADLRPLAVCEALHPIAPYCTLLHPWVAWGANLFLARVWVGHGKSFGGV